MIIECKKDIFIHGKKHCKKGNKYSASWEANVLTDSDLKFSWALKIENDKGCIHYLVYDDNKNWTNDEWFKEHFNVLEK